MDFGGRGGGGGSFGGNKICYAYQKGECDRGSNCRFSHGEGRGGRGYFVCTT